LWHNPGFRDFEGYLTSFKSSQRRNIRREVQRMAKAGIQIRAHQGDDIPPSLAGLMYRYYLNTNAQYGPWAARYLNADFFERVFHHHRRRLLIIAAYHPLSGRTPIALSMLLAKKEHLIGRYWGCASQIKDLHFNMCFYAPIEWSIANGIQTFDPGAGSPHKIYRGFSAVANTSLHRFYDSRLNFLFQGLIGEVNRMEHENIRALNRKLPFSRKAG
jgi:predicted N-acyltransferase